MKALLIIFIIFIIVDIGIIGYVLYRRFGKKLSPKKKQEIQKAWRSIIRLTDPRRAILDADNLLDHALGELGYRGTLGGKLKKNPKLFSDIDAIWSAHKVRNNIAHQIHYEVNPKVYKKTMLAFKQAFTDLKFF